MYTIIHFNMKNFISSVLVVLFCAHLSAQNYYLIYTQPGVDKLEYQFTAQNSLVYSAYRFKEDKKNFFFDTGLESPEQITKVPTSWININAVTINSSFVNDVNAHTVRLHILTPYANGYAANTVGSARVIENTTQGMYFNDATAEFNFDPNKPPVSGQDISVPRDLSIAKAAVFLTDQTTACNSKAYAFKSVPLQTCVSEFNALVHPQWGILRETNGNGENKNFELVRINGSEVCPYINGQTKNAIASLKEMPVTYETPSVPKEYSVEVVRGKSIADTNFPREFAPNNSDMTQSDNFGATDPCDMVAAPNEYIVKQGDNLNSIARANNLTVNGLKALNKMSSDIIFACTKLIVVDYNSAPTPTAQTNNYVTSVPSEYNVEVVKKNNYNDLNVEPQSLRVNNAPCNLQVIEGEHLVRDGETLAQIAELYNTNVNAIVELNNLNESDIAPCTILKIPEPNLIYAPVPISDAVLPTNYNVQVVKRKNVDDNNGLYMNTVTTKAPKVVCNVSAKSNEYVVQSGDNIFSIARKYGIPAHHIMALNKLKSNTIRPCEVLKIAADAKPEKVAIKSVKKKSKPIVTSKGVKKTTPKSVENVAVSPNLIIRKGTGIYVVRKGETVRELCLRNNISDLEFRRINNLSATEEPLAGQVVKTELCNCSADIGPVPLAYNVKSIKVRPLTTPIESVLDSTSVSLNSVPVQDRKYHVVEEHETLYSISKKYSTSVQKLKDLNNLTDSDIISPKQVLVLQ